MQHYKTLKITLWGHTLGYLALLDNNTIAFEYEADFRALNWEISPFELPLATTTQYQSMETSPTFQRLPGVIADCLPDIYGKSAIEGFYRQSLHWNPESLTVLDYLAYIGDRSMGALEFHPAMDRPGAIQDHLEIRNLIDAARKTLEGRSHEVLPDLLKVSASAGGRQAKAIVDFNPETLEIRSGIADPAPGFLPCILKFDGMRDGEEPNFYGRLEYIYAALARRAGIKMPQTWLIEDELDYGPAAHFIVERFDRSSDKTKNLHYASLCGLLLRDFRVKHACDYETYFGCVQQLTQDASQIEEAFRRAAFNIVFRNQDDHTRNLGFTMDRSGVWHLAPAFDLNYVYGQGTSYTHQMMLGGKDDDFARRDFIAAGKPFGIRPARMNRILDEIHAAGEQFLQLAAETCLDEQFAEGIHRRFRII